MTSRGAPLEPDPKSGELQGKINEITSANQKSNQHRQAGQTLATTRTQPSRLITITIDHEHKSTHTNTDSVIPGHLKRHENTDAQAPA